MTFDGSHTDGSNISTLVHKNVYTFLHPMSGDNFTVAAGYNYAKELRWQIQIGSKMFSEYPVRSLAETFYQLKKALWIHGSAYHSLSITPEQYRTCHFIIRIDTEKILEAGFTGLNTRSGDLMIVRGKYANSNDYYVGIINSYGFTVWSNSRN